MIYIDVDGVLVDFYGAATKHFGIELAINSFGNWTWGIGGYPTAEEFYKVAEPQPWFYKLIDIVAESSAEHQFLTKDCVVPKRAWFYLKARLCNASILEAPAGKAEFCTHPCDVLIDDNPHECLAWKSKGGMAYWFNLAERDPFGKFLKWWRMRK
jgi:hypothetical protein